MALHENEVSMLREALPEYLALARLGLTTKKQDGGILGYPTTTLLLAVVDTIGSYFREHPTFKVQVDGVAIQIKKTSDHILILNSEFFGYSFSDAQLRDIYRLCRSPLTHNAIIGEGHVLVPGNPGDPAFTFEGGEVVTSVAGLYEACGIAVQVFLQVAAGVVPESAALADIRGKAVRAAAARPPGGAPGGYVASASATGRKS